MSGKRHESLIKTPKQLVIVLVLSFAVPVIVIILLANLATSGRIYDEETKSPEAVAKRIKPVAEVNMATAGTEFNEPAAGAPQAPAVASEADGDRSVRGLAAVAHDRPPRCHRPHDGAHGAVHRFLHGGASNEIRALRRRPHGAEVRRAEDQSPRKGKRVRAQGGARRRGDA